MIKDHTASDFKYESLDNHKIALVASPIGAEILRFIERKKIEIIQNDELPERIHGMYVSKPFHPGHIEYGECTNALVIAHEGRHAWQADVLSRALLSPKSPQDYVLKERFIEADARAIHFATTLQIVNALRLDNHYAELLLEALSPREKQLFASNPKNIEAICSNRSQFLKTVRKAFDCWMIDGLGTSYDEQIQGALSKSHTSNLARMFYVSAVGLGAFKPCFTEVTPDSDYPGQLGEVLGDLGDGLGDNYLLDTDGPTLNDPFYTRVCNVHVERAIDRVHMSLQR